MYVVAQCKRADTHTAANACRVCALFACVHVRCCAVQACRHTRLASRVNALCTSTYSLQAVLLPWYTLVFVCCVFVCAVFVHCVLSTVGV